MREVRGGISVGGQRAAVTLNLDVANLGIVSTRTWHHWRHDLRDWHRREHLGDRWDSPRGEDWDDQDYRRARRSRHRHWRHGPPLPLLILFFVFAATHMAAIIGAVFLATLTAALVVGAILLARYGATEGMRYLAARRSRSRNRSLAAHRAPADRRLSPVVAGPTAYRQQLLEVLKDRYVRGEIALAEFEERVAQVVRDPSAKHLA